jgi:hypothetical protein
VERITTDLNSYSSACESVKRAKAAKIPAEFTESHDMPCASVREIIGLATGVPPLPFFKISLINRSNKVVTGVPAVPYYSL